MNHSSWNGRFVLHARGARCCCLRDAGGVTLLLFGVSAPPLEAGGAFERVEVRWRAAGADVRLLGTGPALQFQVDAVIVQQALPRLFEALPLAVLDARTRRFWRRVFWLVRVPGGAALIRWLAGRTRAKA